MWNRKLPSSIVAMCDLRILLGELLLDTGEAAQDECNSL